MADECAAAAKVALLIDWENVKDADPCVLVKTAERYGRLVLGRAYGGQGVASEKLYHAGIEPVYVPTGQNSVDVRLAVDCMELCVTEPEIDVFVLASGDHSLIHVIPPLRRRFGKRVVVIAAEKRCADVLAKFADVLIHYGSLAPIVATPTAVPTPSVPSAVPPVSSAALSAPKKSHALLFDGLVEIVREYQANGKPTTIQSIGGIFAQKYKFKEQGFTNFKAVAQAAVLSGRLELLEESGTRVLRVPGQVKPAGIVLSGGTKKGTEKSAKTS